MGTQGAGSNFVAASRGRPTYRHDWELLERARLSGQELPEEAERAFFGAEGQSPGYHPPMAKADAGRTARAILEEAVKDVECRSAAEVVIALRQRSDRWPGAALILAGGLGLSMLAFLLFSPWEFTLLEILMFTAGAALLGGLLASIPPIGRALTSASARRRRVEEAARALFVERRVHQTTGRTGVLVYLSRVERVAAVIPDIGVEAEVAGRAWDAAVGRLEAAMGRGAEPAELAACVRGLGDVLAPALPRSADDVNELCDEVVS